MSRMSIPSSEEKQKKVRKVEPPPPAVYMTPSKEEEEFHLWARVPTFRKSSATETAQGATYRVQEKAVVHEIRPVYALGKIVKKKVIKKRKHDIKEEDEVGEVEGDEGEEIEEEVFEIDQDFIEREALMVDTSPFERELEKPILGYTYIIPFPDTSLTDVALREDLGEIKKEYDRFSEISGLSAISDPGNEDAFLEPGGEPTDFRDIVGEKHYQYMCRQLDVIPSQNFIRQLRTDYASFRFYGLNPKAMRPICEALSKNIFVRYLDLEDNWLTYDSVTHLADLFRENEIITGLNLTGCRLGAESAWKLSEIMRVTRSLEELLLSNNDLGDRGAAALAEGVINNRSILKLDLSHNHLSAGACIALGGALAMNGTIRNLDLSWNLMFDKDGFKKLAEGLSSNEEIESLNLTGNVLGIEVMRSLRSIINKNKNLKFLDISFNRINDQCLSQIRKAVAKNDNLHTLRLANNPISSNATSNLLAAFQKFGGQIEILDLNNIWVDKKYIEIEKEIKAIRQFNTINAGVISNYVLHRPDEIELLLKRAYFEGKSPKKKKKKRDFGHFLLKAPKRPITTKAYTTKIHDEKLKIVPTLVDELGRRFMTPKGKVDLQKMKDRYLQIFPDTALPKPKEKKKKGKKGGKKGKKGKKVGEAPVAVEEAPPRDEGRIPEAATPAAGTDSAVHGPEGEREEGEGGGEAASEPWTSPLSRRTSRLPGSRPSLLLLAQTSATTITPEYGERASSIHQASS